MFKIAAAITIILCPVIVLLNVLVILAVKTKRELKEHNSNILLASLAIADVLTGVIIHQFGCVTSSRAVFNPRCFL